MHYAGCTVCHPPEGKLSEEVRSGISAVALPAVCSTGPCIAVHAITGWHRDQHLSCFTNAVQVIRGCNDEFAKAYRFARCNLAAAYTNLSAAAICHYPAVDLSDMSIRLGV